MWAGARVVRARAPCATLSRGTVPGYVAEAPASKAPWALVLHPAKLTGWQARKEAEDDTRGRWFRKAPGDDQTGEGRTILVKSASRVDARQLLGQGRVSADRVTSKEVRGKLARPYRRVLKLEGEGQKLPTRYAVDDIRAAAGDVHEAGRDGCHLDFSLVTVKMKISGDFRQPAKLEIY